MYSSLFGTQLHMTTKLTYLMTVYYTPTTALPPMMHRFISTNWFATLQVAVSFQLIVTLIFKPLTGTPPTSLQVYCQAAKGEHKLGVKIFCKNLVQVGLAYKKRRNKTGMRTQEVQPAKEKLW